MIRKVLVANRGEIAVRIMRSCREMNIACVAVYSHADRKSQHVRYADEAYYIGPSPSDQSYLNIDMIINTARQSGADAIHPGYGFLSENADFAQRVADEGLIFIGPSPTAIRSMGDKITAREIMINAGVNVVPGTNKKLSNQKELIKTATEIGYPLIIKASAGGGGKGMRLVYHEKDLLKSYHLAQSEAKTAFNNDTVFIEKYIEYPHHIEFQILADKYGNTVHLYERECSIQRRHQKVIEETPSPFITPALREKMAAQAIAAAKSVNYYGAGTIEFLVDEKRNFYFLEMNTRLQVEHPITERVTGIDLVKQQILIAAGNTLNFEQADIKQNGHAIECRIYAEDPGQNFMPSPGKIKQITEPLGLGVRTDGYVYKGYKIPMHYDPLISKLIVWAQTRPEAIQRMKRALYEYQITGVKTSIPFLKKILGIPDFENGTYNTHFIAENENILLSPDDCELECEDMAILLAYIDYTRKIQRRSNSHKPTKKSVWREFGIRKSINRI